MVGSRLEAHVHIITGAVTAIKNLMKSCEMAKLNVEEVVLQQYASSLSALTEDERRLGVVLLDIGGGTTDIIVYKNGHVEQNRGLRNCARTPEVEAFEAKWLKHIEEVKHGKRNADDSVERAVA